MTDTAPTQSGTTSTESIPTQQARTATGNAIVAPNAWFLTGHGVTVTLEPDLTGQQRVTYQDASRSLSFPGEDGAVTREDTAIGTLVTVPIVRTVDIGDTTFSIVLPRVNLLGSTSHAVHTIGITTRNRVFAGAIGHSQLSTSTAIALSGTASQIQT